MYMFFVFVLCALTAHAFEIEVCKDFTVRCKAWKRYCNDEFNKRYMKIYCKDTCGWCPKCEDETPLQCKHFECNDPTKEEFARKNCRLTCGICVPPTTAPPKPPTPAWVVKPAGKCGVPRARVRVIGGVNARKGAWPWQVLIRFIGAPHCGGALVSPFWVVTAAHCVYQQEALIDEYRVVTGEHDFNKQEGTETSIHLSKIIVHKKYSPTTLDYDIALLKLNRPAPFGTYVGTVCLPDYNNPVAIGTMCMITGWGKISATGRMHHLLQQATMPVVGNEKCYNLNTNDTNIKITDRMLCAGHGPGNKISGCHGDSGGPLVCYSSDTSQWFLQGAVSWGSSTCNSTEAYTVFSRVSYLREWIDSNMRE